MTLTAQSKPNQNGSRYIQEVCVHPRQLLIIILNVCCWSLFTSRWSEARPSGSFHARFHHWRKFTLTVVDHHLACRKPMIFIVSTYYVGQLCYTPASPPQNENHNRRCSPECQSMPIFTGRGHVPGS